MSETSLIITSVGFPPMSARGCHQELVPLPNGEFRKTVNGDNVFLKESSIRKYRTVIKGSDMHCPSVGNIWIGSTVRIGCIQRIWQGYSNGHEEIILTRPPVEESVSVIDLTGEQLEFSIKDTVIKLKKPIDEQIFVSFRPWLTMKIVDFCSNIDEWSLTSHWKLVAEEI